MTLETYIMELETWTKINEDVPMYVKYQDFMEIMKLSKDIKGLSRFVGEHVLPILQNKIPKNRRQEDNKVVKLASIFKSKK